MIPPDEEFNTKFPFVAKQREFKTVEELRAFIKPGCILYAVTSYYGRPDKIVEFHIQSEPEKSTVKYLENSYMVKAIIYYGANKGYDYNLFLGDMQRGCKAVFTDKKRAEEWLELIKQLPL
jgi:hypothetical protein